MNPVVRWFHQLGSPPYFDRFAQRWAPWAYGLALLVMAYGLYGALFMVPADYQQGDSFRILYIHVPSAWMSMAIFALMAIYAAIALVWRIKLCEILAMACAPIGAAFTLITLATGSIWGKPMWGTWWDWDPRLTTELILLFLYLGVIGLYNAIDDRRAAAGDRAGAVREVSPRVLSHSRGRCAPEARLNCRLTDRWRCRISSRRCACATADRRRSRGSGAAGRPPP